MPENPVNGAAVQHPTVTLRPDFALAACGHALGTVAEAATIPLDAARQMGEQRFVFAQQTAAALCRRPAAGAMAPMFRPGRS